MSCVRIRPSSADGTRSRPRCAHSVAILAWEARGDTACGVILSWIAILACTRFVGSRGARRAHGQPPARCHAPRGTCNARRHACGWGIAPSGACGARCGPCSRGNAPRAAAGAGQLVVRSGVRSGRAGGAYGAAVWDDLFYVGRGDGPCTEWGCGPMESHDHGPRWTEVIAGWVCPPTCPECVAGVRIGV